MRESDVSRSSGSTRARRSGNIYSPIATSPAIPDFDLRTTRDLSSRRIWRETARQVVRTVVLLAGDGIAASAAIWLSFWLTGELAQNWPGFVPRILLLVFFGQATAGTYRGGRADGTFGKVLLGSLAASAALFGLDVFYGIMQLSGPAHLSLVVATTLSLGLWRAGLVLAIRRMYRAGIGRTRTLIVAEQEKAWAALERFQSADEPRTLILGHVVPEEGTDPTALGTVHEIGRFIEDLDVAQVVISAHLDRDLFRTVVKTCFLHGTAVSVVPETIAEIPCRIASRELLGWPMLEMQPPRFHLTQVGVKRAVDVVGSALALLTLSPLFALIALAIRLDSRGPVFFSQSRPGLGGRRFQMLKFRTMRPDAEAVLQADPELYAKFLANDCKLPEGEDPRISRLGHFLRATSLDELPQLINVMRGDMSLIGPRPMVGPELAHYGEAMPVVLAVRPGMTGYWQVAGRSSVMYPERAHLDVYYVTHWSLGLDLKILGRTFPAVFRRSGAF